MRDSSFFRVAAIVFLAVLAGGVWKAGANNNLNAPAGPPVVALVNLERVLNNLDELQARNAELQAWVDERQKTIRELEAQVKDKVTRLQILPPDSPEYARLQEEALRTRVDAEFQAKFRDEMLSRKQGQVNRALFDKVRDGLRRFSEQRGYNLVLSHDGDIEILGEEGNLAVTRQIAARRILYTDPSLDVSDELLQFLNNEWKAGNP